MDKQLAHYTSASASATIDIVISGMNSIYTSISDLEVTTTNVILSLGFVTLVISPFIFTWYLDTKNYNDNTTEDLMDETISILENLEKSKIPELDPYKGIEICLTNFKSFLVKEGPSKFLQLEEPVSEELSQYKGIFLTNFNSKSKSFLVKEGPSKFLQLEEPVLEELSQQEIEGLTQQEIEEPVLEELTQQEIEELSQQEIEIEELRQQEIEEIEKLVEKFLNNLKENLTYTQIERAHEQQLQNTENTHERLYKIFLDTMYQMDIASCRENLIESNEEAILESLTTRFNHEIAEDIFDILQYIVRADLYTKKTQHLHAKITLNYWDNEYMLLEENEIVADQKWEFASNNNQIFNSMDQNELKELNELERIMHINNDSAKEKVNKLVNSISVEDIMNISEDLEDIFRSIGNSVEISKGEIAKILINNIYAEEPWEELSNAAWNYLNTIYNLGEILVNLT